MPITKNDQLITSMADWQRLAPPKSAHHWVDDRSAKEVARAWLEGGGAEMPSEVNRTLSAHPSFGPVLSWRAEPEARLRFDDLKGEPRNSDLAVTVHDAHGSYFLAVEAKADEPYGETVAETFAAALERRLSNPRSKGIARIEALASGLLCAHTAKLPKAANLRYQLLTATAGCIAEARRQGASRAVLLVHEFITHATRDENHEHNSADLANFLARLGGAPVDGIVDATLYGPFDTAFGAGVNLYVGKVVRPLREPLINAPHER